MLSSFLDFSQVKEENIFMSELVEVVEINPRVILEILYATPRNFTGQIIYPSGRCFLQKKTAIRVDQVQCKLEKIGLGLKIFDGYRPQSVQKIFWHLCPDPRFVADPKVGSKHSRGASVDVTLVDELGNQLIMPTEFDDFSERASHEYMGALPEAIKNRSFLKQVMTDAGFLCYEHEWWHYDDPDWAQYPLLDFPL